MKSAGNLGKVLLVTGGLIFFIGFSVANYSLYFLLAGGLLGVSGFYMVNFIDKKVIDKSVSEFNQWKNKLKASGTEVEVPLDQCELKSNKYREEMVKELYAPTDKYMALDSMIGHHESNYKTTDQSVIVYGTVFNGQNMTFYSPLINKEQSTLKFLLSGQGTTKIYVDRDNHENYYFDLEFLYR